EDLGARGAVARAIGELARQPQFAGRGLARQLALLAPALALLGALGDAVEQYPWVCRIGAQRMVEMFLDGAFDEPCCFGGGQPLLCLPLKLRVADEQREACRGAGSDVLARCLGDTAIADELPIPLDAS